MIPDWKEKGAPLDVPVKEDNFYILGEAGQIRLPNSVMPPLMNNHGNYIVSMGNLCRWMAEQAEELGVEIFPGMACSELVYGKTGEVKGVVAGEFGKNPDGSIGDSYEPGMELLGKYILLSEGARGSLSKEVIEKFNLDAECDVPKFGIGMKEIWEVDPGSTSQISFIPIPNLGTSHSASKLNFSITSFDSDPLACLLYTSPSPRDRTRSRMPSSA